MSRIGRHLRLGVQWLVFGWRLFLRNPWLLGGMGATAALLTTVLWAIPLLGGPLVAFVAPIMLAGFYLAIDRVNKLSMPLPAVLRRSALKQSPRELFAVFREERRIGPMLVVSLYSIFACLIINMLVWFIAGSAWTKSWMDRGVVESLLVLAAVTLALILYFLLSASMVYALPRTFLRDKALIPEIGRSVRAGTHYVFALVVALAPLLVPLLLGAAMAYVSPVLAYLAAFMANIVIIPLVACGLYCSYLKVFQPRPPVAAHA